MSKLAIRNYAHSKSFFDDEDFQSVEVVISVLNEVLTGECDLTSQGKIYLEDKYGYVKLAQEIVNCGGLVELENGKDVKSVELFLQNIKPMETSDFIQSNHE
jgi:hypothetical protein